MDGILQPHHIKAGFSLQGDNHNIILLHRGRSIGMWSTTGSLSKYEIREVADDFTKVTMNPRGCEYARG